ncbi:MAG TPA: UPF0149 family protein [Rhizomicrobium sp.]|jgi:uncharacterized protein
MTDPPELPFEGDLEALDAFLMSDRSPPECMMLSDLDGFLAAIAAGPELIMPSEWLPAIFGGEMPEFADEQEAKMVIGTIMSRSLQIAAAIRDGGFEPILWKKKDGTVIAMDWAEGFAAGMGLRPDAWRPLLESEWALLLTPIILLCEPDAASELGLNQEDQNRMLAEAPAALTHCVIEIDKFWRKHRAPIEVRTNPSTSPKTGRNEPCPCGSGRKFKKCCGRSVH